MPLAFTSWQISDKRLRQFKENLSSEVLLEASGQTKRMRKRQDGCEEVKDELDQLNKTYIEMVDWANVRLRQIADTLATLGDNQVGCKNLSRSFIFVSSFFLLLIKQTCQLSSDSKLVRLSDKI